LLHVPLPRRVTLLPRLMYSDIEISNVPAASITTSPEGHEAMALLMLFASSLLAGGVTPLGLTVAQTVVRFGIPPTESSPAFAQFAEASL
jgi:hypothetical protein